VPRSRTVGGGGGTMISRAIVEREGECGDKNLLSVVRESAGPKILVRGA
jgi:hypothetical protein